MDEVDELVIAWRRERPDLDVEPMQIWSRVGRLARVLSSVRTRVFESHQLQTWEFDVLSALRRSGSPYQMTPGQLLASTHVASGTMTNRLDRLSARGLVARQSNPEDGRGVIVELTCEGRGRVDAALADLVRAQREMIPVLSADDQQSLARLLRTLLLASAD